MDYKLAKFDLEDAQERIDRARNILFVIGSFLVGFCLFNVFKNGDPIKPYLTNILAGTMYIIASFMTKKYPVISIGLP